MLLKNVDNQEKQVKKSTNGNRRYSMLLLALLFIGMGTYGTYAYFTDSTSVDGNIKLSTGTVSFAEIQDTEWVYTPVTGKENKKILPFGSEYDFSNVQPGDKFTKTATVTYTGSLDGVLTINQASLPKTGGLDYTIKVNGNAISPNDSSTVVSKDDPFEVTLEATVPLGEEEKYHETEGRNKNNGSIIELSEAVTFTVEQNK